MLGDTISITINSVAKVLSKINQDSYSAEYVLRSTTEEFRMKVRHSLEKPSLLTTGLDRHNVELTHTVYATATVPKIVRQVYGVIRNLASDDATQVGYLQVGLNGFMTAANVAKLYNWES